MTPLISILTAIVVLIILVALFYNNLIGSRNNVENAFGSMDVMLKKRYDLIPNLVETVKVYMKHEKDTLTQLSALRTQALASNTSTDEKVGLENQLSGMMHSVMVAVENYPDLKASEQFTMLQRSWNEAEEQISAARRNYNSAVTQYNNAIEKFPSNILANIFRHKRKPVFVIPDAERQSISARSMFAN
jgi:LemA protein